VNGVLNADTTVSFKSRFEAGAKTVLMRLTTDSGCVYFDSVRFVIHALPIAKPIFVSGKSICLGERMILKSQSKGQQFWIIGGDTVSKTDSVNVKPKSFGAYARIHYIKDSMGCVNFSYDTMFVHEPANAKFTSNPDSVICLGGTYTLTASDTVNQLKWTIRNFTKDSLVLGSRSIDVNFSAYVELYSTTAYNCKDSSGKSIVFRNLPKKLRFQIIKPAVYPGDTIVVAVYPNAQWPKGNHAVWTKPFASTDSILKFRVADTGMLYFQVKNMNDFGCVSDTTGYAQYFGPSNVGQIAIQNISVYPNPNNGTFSLDLNQPISNVSIFDMSGRKMDVVIKSMVHSNHLNIQMKEFAKGVYFVNGVFNNGTRFVSKFVIN
jgi:hypothetical protein